MHGSKRTARRGLLWQTMALMLVACLALLGGQVQAAETVTYVYTDLQGTVLAKADAAGNLVSSPDYRPYGSQVSGTPEAGPGYTGHVTDPDSGLVYMQARYYDPTIGRFLSVDPSGGDPGDLFVSGRYSYASNNPVLNVDPDGKQSVPGYYINGTDFRDPAARDFAFNLFVPGYAVYGCASSGCNASEWTIAVASTFLSVAPAGEAALLARAERAAVSTARAGGEAANVVNSSRLNVQLAAEQISSGHAFEKHVLNQGEFQGLGIRTRGQFAEHIENVLTNPSDVRYYSDGRAAYLQRSSSTVVIRDPAREGTAFQPQDWDKYVKTLPKNTSSP